MSLEEFVAAVEAALKRPLKLEEAKAAFQYHKAGLPPDDLVKDLTKPAQKPGLYRYEAEGRGVRRV